MKKADIKNLSAGDIQNKLAEVKTNFNKLKLSHAISPIENPIQIKDMRKTSVFTLYNMEDINTVHQY